MPAEKPSSSTGGYELAPAKAIFPGDHTPSPSTVIAAVGSASVQPSTPDLEIPAVLARGWWLRPLLAWVVVMLCVNLAAQIAFHSPQRSPFFPSWAYHPGWSPHQHALIRWDGIRYWQIAHWWYRTINVPVGTANTANYPGYPAVVLVLSRMIPLPVWVWLLLVSNAASAAAAILLYRLAAELFPDQPAVPMLTVLSFLLQPEAVFLFAAYTEPIFDVLMILFFFAMLHQRWWVAAIIGAVADLVRPTGVVFSATLFVILIGAVVAAWRAAGKSGLSIDAQTSAPQGRPAIAPATALGRAIGWPAVAASGFILWAAWLAWETGNPWMVLDIQRWVHVGLTWKHTMLALDVGKTFHRMTADLASSADTSHITALENACALFTPLVLLAMLLPKVRLPTPLWLVALFLWLIPFFSHSKIHYQGMGRYQLATSLPLWIFFGLVMAKLPPRWAWLCVPLLSLSTLWMFMVTMRFTQGFWVG